MEQQLIRKGQVLRGYLRKGTQIVVLQGRLDLRLEPQYLAEQIWPHTVMLVEGESWLFEQGAWVSLNGDGLFILHAPAARIKRFALKIKQLVSVLQ